MQLTDLCKASPLWCIVLRFWLPMTLKSMPAMPCMACAVMHWSAASLALVAYVVGVRPSIFFFTVYLTQEA